MSNRNATIFFLTILAIALATVIYAPKIFGSKSKALEALSAQNAANRQFKPISLPQVQLKKVEIKERVFIKKVKANAIPSRPKPKINVTKIAESKKIENNESNQRSPEPKNSPCQVTLSEKALQDTIIKNFLDRYQCSAN